MFSKEKQKKRRKKKWAVQSEKNTNEKNKRANLLDVHILEICETVHKWSRAKKNGGRFRIVREFFSAFIAGNRPLDYYVRNQTWMRRKRKQDENRATSHRRTHALGEIVTIITVVIICCIGVVRHRSETVITNLMLSLLFCVRSCLFFAHALFNERLYCERRGSRASMHLWLLDVDSSNWWLLFLSSGRSCAIICLASHRLTSLSSRPLPAVCVWLFW